MNDQKNTKSTSQIAMNLRKNHRSFLSRRVSFIWSIVFIIFLCFNISTLLHFYTRSVESERNIPALEVKSGDSPAVSVSETVIFLEQALVFLKYPPSTALFSIEDISCIYLYPNSSWPHLELSSTSIDGLDENQQIVRCTLPPYGTIVSVRVKNYDDLVPGPTYEWDSLAYEAIIDRDNSTIVFVKGLNLPVGEVVNTSKFKCVYGWDLSNSKYVLRADVVSIAQEIVRCRTPLSILQTFSSNLSDPIKVSVRIVGKRTLDSVARLKRRLDYKPRVHDKQFKMCVCTMLRNQAQSLREWVMYHASIEVERWFIYDNSNNDGVENVVQSLVGANHNITRHLWPWIKSQEACYAHCALRARDSCEWVGFIDVDEFFHFPYDILDLALFDIVRNKSRPSEVAELRVPCHIFGPSGLQIAPMEGVMVGYTCRLAGPKGHRSIVKPEALNPSLINMVHHFHLKSGFRHVDMNETAVVINHYKYQVWKVFREKYYNSVAPYASDWHQERDVKFKEDAPGSGMEDIEPWDWSTRFCEVNDTGLRDLALETFTDPNTGLLPWEDQQDL